MNRQFIQKCKQDIARYGRFINGYANSKNGSRKAVFVARRNPLTEQIEFGYAICSPKDKFNRHVGMKIALDRMSDSRINDADFDSPSFMQVREDFYNFQQRIRKYFKTEGIDFSPYPSFWV